MAVRQKYALPYKGLSLGNHTFEFEIDDRFFQAVEGSEIHRGNASVQVGVDKQSRGLTLRVKIEGGVEVTCDRCLGEFLQPVCYEGTLQVRFSETEQESDGEILWISPNETEVDLGLYLHESICLSLPYQRVHPEDEQGQSLCDPDMLSRFRIVSEEEFEQLVRSGSGQEGEPMPREALEQVKTDLARSKK